MKAIVCFSGGLDSTVALAVALLKHTKDDLTAMFVNYGQRNISEEKSAIEICNHYGVELTKINASRIFDWHNSNLLAANPKGSNYEIQYRNGIFFQLAVSYAANQFYGEQIEIYSGINGGYCDCTSEYASIINDSIEKSTMGKMRLITPFVNLNKAEIMRLGLEIDAPIFMTRSCLSSGDIECGKCPACKDKKIAMMMNGYGGKI